MVLYNRQLNFSPFFLFLFQAIIIPRGPFITIIQVGGHYSPHMYRTALGTVAVMCYLSGIIFKKE